MKPLKPLLLIGLIYSFNVGAIPPQYGISSVKPTSSGTCFVAGISTGPWPGSPCEKIYGATPITISISGTPLPSTPDTGVSEAVNLNVYSPQ